MRTQWAQLYWSHISMRKTVAWLQSYTDPVVCSTELSETTADRHRIMTNKAASNPNLSTYSPGFTFPKGVLCWPRCGTTGNHWRPLACPSTISLGPSEAYASCTRSNTCLPLSLILQCRYMTGPQKRDRGCWQTPCPSSEAAHYSLLDPRPKDSAGMPVACSQETRFPCTHSHPPLHLHSHQRFLNILIRWPTFSNDIFFKFHAVSWKLLESFF